MLKIQINALIMLTHREVRRFLRIWSQTLVPPAVTIGLYFVIFGTLIGPRIGKMSGFDYIQFMVPGLVMMSVITSSYANVSTSFYGNKFQRSIEEILVSPMHPLTILLGFIFGGIVRGAITALIVTLVALFFTELPIYSISMTIVVALMAATLFSLTGLLNGIYAETFDQVSIVPNFILLPLIYLGGVFYSIDLLPEHWQLISKLNPILYFVSLFRYAMLGVSDIPVLTSLTMILAFIAAFGGLCYYLLVRGVGIRE